MINTLIAGLLPVIFTICLGYLAAAIKSFDSKAPSVLNKAVMSYAVPLAIFIQLNQIPKKTIFNNWKILLWLFLFIIGWWFIVYLISHKIFHASVQLSAIRAFSISTPAILFVGPALLPLLFPKTAGMTISLGGLIMCIALPITFTFLASTNKENAAKGGFSKFWGSLFKAIKNPIVIAEILGFGSSILNLHLPVIYAGTFTQLGKAGAGLGLFTIGITLYQHKPSFSKAVWVNVGCKEIIVPLSAFFLMSLAHENASLINELTLTMAISEIVFPSILAQQYKTGERELTSSMFISTVFSFIVLAGIIILRGITI